MVIMIKKTPSQTNNSLQSWSGPVLKKTRKSPKIIGDRILGVFSFRINTQFLFGAKLKKHKNKNIANGTASIISNDLA
ncbi:MAG: hypothetical protein WC501_01350 [Candidatus Micrarchaeia archaeon]|jgi:hypothetical protein